MSSNKTQSKDRRILRTRSTLRTALMALIAEGGYERLSVQDITERAGVGRATFYLHYTDKEQLLLDCIEHAVEELTNQFAELGSIPLAQRAVVMAERMFEHMASNAAVYRTLMSENGVASLPLRVRNLTATAIAQDLGGAFPALSQNQVRLEALAQHTAGALLALAEWWLRNHCPGSAAEMAQLHVQLSAPGMFALISNSRPG
jgi:AcrR family transcriptional regulator